MAILIFDHIDDKDVLHQCNIEGTLLSPGEKGVIFIGPRKIVIMALPDEYTVIGGSIDIRPDAQGSFGIESPVVNE